MANKKQKFITRISSEIRNDIRNGLLEHGKVKVIGLGIFEMRQIPQRRGRNPKNGEIVMINSYWKVKFKPTSSLREAVCK